jgi:hypothetical protein
MSKPNSIASIFLHSRVNLAEHTATQSRIATSPFINHVFCGSRSHSHSQSLCLNSHSRLFPAKPRMAAATTTRAIAVASNTTASCLFFKRPLLLKRNSLCFKNPRGATRLFTCRAIYNPEALQIKEEGQPETLDYRVFFVDNSSKKVLSLFPSRFAY